MIKKEMASKVKDLKKDLILEETSKYFEEIGFENIKMSDLAKNCDISVGQLYKLFVSKENLYYEYVSYQIRLFYDKLQKLCLNVQEPEDRLLIYLDMKFDTFKSKRKVFEAPVMGDPLFFSKMNTKQEKLAKPIYEFLQKEFEKLARKKDLSQDVDFLQVAYVFNSFSMGYIEHWLNTKGELEIDSKDVLKRFIRGFTSK
jgi:AcrR family transcriptional regulator